MRAIEVESFDGTSGSLAYCPSVAHDRRSIAVGFELSAFAFYLHSH